MKLEELLDELRSNILRDVSDLVSSSNDDLLWSTVSLVRYINDGYFKFARETRIIQDDSTEKVTQITLEEGVARYALHTSVLSVRSAVFGDLELSRQKHQTLSREDSGIARHAAHRVTTGGRIFGFSTDKKVKALQVYDAPKTADAGGILELTVSRLPILSLSVQRLSEELEIPEDYQLDVLEWAAYKALKNHDTDGENAEKAESHRLSFFNAVNSARREVAMAANSPVQFRIVGARW